MKSKLYLIIIALIFTRLNYLYGQYDSVKSVAVMDSIPIDSVMSDLPESVNEDLLKLLEMWNVNNFTSPEENCYDEDTPPEYPDSVYIQRMQSMPYLVRMNYNEMVRKYIDFYTTGKMRNKVRYMMGMSYYYFPMIEQKLDKAGLPVELKYLAIVESALNPVIRSHKGAYGLWQFMLPTAKNSGLEINSLIDERLDPERATDAACIYLQRLYNIFKDWHLAIAAYNCGDGNVLKAIRRAGGNRDFWQIFQYLPRETRSYLPLYMAAAYVMDYHSEHHICPIMPDFSVSTDTLMVSRNLSFEQISDVLKIEKETIKFYNPQYKKDIIPGGIRPSSLRLPVRNLYGYIDSPNSALAGRLDSLIAICLPKIEEEESEIDNRKITATASAKSSKTTSVPVDGSKYALYTVKSGDTLSGIAGKYKGVTVTKIQSANGLTSTKLKIGQILKIPQT
ncbi:MAG: transglycosylase SLT domain-containing protein [Tannerella sp.]|jgi:membrane-bound lytic murein transglycosylase D|nr:transglycosylase SLT domain-containing protein [Tannerella sp.]